jgi:hypothetical protein
MSMKALILAAGLSVAVSSLVLADEVTTTTKKTDSPPAAVVVTPAPEDCSHKKMTKTDEDTGTTVTKKETHCD